MLVAFISLGALYLLVQMLADDPEIALLIDEPWEDMRQRSSASIGPAVPGRAWFGMPKSDARLRFVWSTKRER
ncbi:hypothetical protein [Pseudomonas sp. NA-150]|uniref:hypothetical protein n=1 Tax=Pseudomonas sp. NA-150 TaxID=3367525 RepID=UPI0037C9E758